MSSRQSQTVSLAAAANYSRSTQSKIERDPQAGDIQLTTISFTAPATISDSANGLGIYGVNDAIDVRGSSLNSRSWIVLTAGAGSITVYPSGIQTAAAGPVIIMQRDS